MRQGTGESFRHAKPAYPQGRSVMRHRASHATWSCYAAFDGLDFTLTAFAQTRSFGSVGLMSGLPESGDGWAIYEYTPN
jgi:hypothetical protein